jgi:phosphoenolpyruvate---glycerone phosphotransferase subunit DhaL
VKTVLLDGAKAAEALREAADTVIAREPLLTKADQAIGDGDHGIGMARGFEAARQALAKLPPGPGPKAAFAAVGTAILSKSGGASGAIFGTLFQNIGKALGDEPADAAAFAAAWRAGALAVMSRGKAKLGDKTMVDALLPAVDALEATQSEGLVAAVRAAADASRRGAEETTKMQASMGRAKMLGERALGHIDPGALTMSFVFEGVAHALALEDRS